MCLCVHMSYVTFMLYNIIVIQRIAILLQQISYLFIITNYASFYYNKLRIFLL